MTETSRSHTHRPARNSLLSAWGWALKAVTHSPPARSTCRSPLLVDTGAFVLAQVQAAEHRAARTLCPFTRLRRDFNRRR